MLKRKLGLLVAAAVIVGMFTSCVVNVNDDKKGGETGNGIDYTNYIGGNYSIQVKNETNKNVVCFMGTPRPENMISGAMASSTTGLRLDTGLFNKTMDFVLFVVTEEDYLDAKKKDAFKDLDNRPLARLYAYYNEDSLNNNMVYTISKHLGGDYKLYLNNMTKYNVELRKDGLYGPALAYSAKQTIKTTIGVDADNYTLFPVFRKLDKASGEIITNYPKTAKGNPQFFAFSLDEKTTEFEIDAKEFITSDFKVTPSQAQLKINNQSKTGVGLYQGTGATATLTSTGGKYVNPGHALTYAVDMDSLGAGTYEEQRSISGWKFGTEGEKFEIPSNTFKAGYRYVVNVTGASYDDLKAEFEKDEKGDILAYEIIFEEE